MSNELYTVYRHLENESEGTDWAMRIREQQLEIRHGPIDEPSTRVCIPARLCHEGTPWKEARLHTDTRLNEGYVRIGLGRFPDDRLALSVRDNSAALALHWASRTEVDKEVFSGLLARIKARLRGAGVRAIHSRSGVSGEPGLAVNAPNGVWKINRRSHGRFCEHNRPGIARVHETDGTVPVLVLMAIERELPGAVRFTWREPDRAQTVAPQVTETDYWLGEHVAPFGDTRRVAHALGLGPAQQWIIGGEDDPSPLWF